ncbi:calmodulin 12 [Brachionus plicatilis]|uniref:Calmodulin 12 n=1 Tax=Brachionus plicatilis TaxID=10195 RepID=A0A3M7RQ49_BRAPC|nr:calmodulin 12 [Brachionus plicatilis]
MKSFLSSTLNKVFHIFDRDHDGSITIDDVQAVMDSFQFLQNELEMPSLEQIRVAFEKFDDNKNGAIEFDEFMNILKSAGSSQAMSPSGTSQDFSFSKNGSKLSQQNSHESNVDYDINKFRNDYSDLVMSNMKLIFEQFDKDNDGKITKHELTFVMRNLFPDEEITEQDISHMLKAADLDNNGFIDFEEFANMFNLYKKNPPSETITSSEFCSPSPKLRSSVKIRKDISRSNKSINSKLNSRNSSKEPGKRSRSQSQSNSASQSPNIANYRKFVQLFTTSQLMDLKAAFTMFDKNGDHKISESELFQVMKYLGLKTTEKEVKAMIQVVDKNQNGYVDYDEFIQMMTQTNIKPQNAEDEVKKTFDIFDIDGNGYISADEIKKTMQNIGENLTDDEVKDMIKAADKNGDGKIDITEFSGLLSGTNIFQS